MREQFRGTYTGIDKQHETEANLHRKGSFQPFQLFQSFQSLTPAAASSKMFESFKASPQFKVQRFNVQ